MNKLEKVFYALIKIRQFQNTFEEIQSEIIRVNYKAVTANKFGGVQCFFNTDTRHS